MKINVSWKGNPQTAKIIDQAGNEIDSIMSMDIHLSSRRPYATADVTLGLFDENVVEQIEVTPQSIDRVKKQIAYFRSLIDKVEMDVHRMENGEER